MWSTICKKIVVLSHIQISLFCTQIRYLVYRTQITFSYNYTQILHDPYFVPKCCSLFCSQITWVPTLYPNNVPFFTHIILISYPNKSLISYKNIAPYFVYTQVYMIIVVLMPYPDNTPYFILKIYVTSYFLSFK